MFFWGALISALLVINGLCADEKKQDFEYKMAEGRYFTRQISYGTKAPTLKIGSFPDMDLENSNSNTEMKCRLSRLRNDYRDSFITHVNIVHESGTLKRMNSTEFAEYFIFKRKELWTCTGTQEKELGLTRIVNELVGSKEIYAVSFPDGVEMFSKPLAPNLNTVYLREIKYLNLAGQPVKYRGWFIFQEFSVDKDFFIPDLLETYKAFERQIRGSGFKEIEYKTNPDKYIDISNEKSHLVVGDPVISTAVPGSELDCTKYQGANPFPFRLRPKCEVKIDNQPVTITKDNYFQYFTPIKDEIWVCGGVNNLQILRLVNDFVTRFAVGEATAHSEVIELRKVVLSKTIGLRVKTVRYFNHSAYNQQMAKFDGIVKLIGSENKELEILPNYVERALTEAKELDYHLHEKCVFKTMVSSRGLSIHLGKHADKKVGNTDDRVQCNLQSSSKTSYLHEYGTRFRLIMRMGEKSFLKAVPRSTHSKYWEFMKQEVWMCESEEAGRNIAFLRIVNELKGLTEFLEVEYHDGIQLYIRALFGNRKSVNLIEIKYINLNTFEPIKYLGKVTLIDQPATKALEFLKCYNCDGQAIRRTEDDIFLAVNSRKDRFAIENRLQGVKYYTKPGFCNCNGYGDISKGYYVLGTSVSSIYGTINDVVDCVPSDTSYKAFPPLIRPLSIDGNNKLKTELPLTAAELTAKKISFENPQVWLCQNPVMKFYRVFNKITFGANVKLCYFDGVDSKGDNSKLTVTAEELKYIDFEGSHIIKYEGDVILHQQIDHSDVISGTVVMENSYALSSITKDHTNAHEVIYSLDMERVHKFDIFKQYQLHLEKTISDRKQLAILEIGQQPLKTDGETANKIVTCKWKTISNDDNKRELHSFQSNYLPAVKLHSDRKNNARVTPHTDKMTLLGRFFTVFGEELWDCSTVDETYKITRVVIKFSYNLNDDTLDEIWYHDGFTLDSGHNSDAPTFHFVSITYHNIGTFTALKYDGKIILQQKPSGDTIGDDGDGTTSYTLLSQASLDTKYELPTGYVYKTVMGNKGAILKIGSHYEKRLKESDVFTDQESNDNMLSCTISSVRPNGIKNSEMLVEIGTDDQLLMKYTKITEERKNAIFSRTVTRYWNCKIENTGLELFRVINVWTAYQDKISDVIHYDGISVEGLDIKEIKYLDGEGKVVRYDGFVMFERTNHYSDQEAKREFGYDLTNGLIHFRSLNTATGPVVEVGSRWTKQYDTNVGDVVCNIRDKDKVEYKKEYHLKITTTKKLSDNTLEKTVMTGVELDKTFSVDRTDAYLCKTTNKVDNVAFIKVINKLETKIDLSAILYQDGITIWKSPTSPGKYIIREVKFVDADKPEIIYKYEKHVKNSFEKKTDRFNEGSSVEEERAPEDYTDEEKRRDWYKDRETWSKGGKSGREPLENFPYSPGIKTKMVQQSTGYNIRVGSHWQKEMGSRKKTFRCSKETASHDESVLLTKIIVIQDYDDYILDKDTMDDFFSIESQEVLKCSKDSESFIRVRTELVGKVGIRLIFHENGVRVLNHRLTIHDTARIVEIKYLDPVDKYQVVKFEGKLEK